MSTKAIYMSRFLLNGSASEMAVNGSGTPAVYSFSPSTGHSVYVRSISIVMADAGASTWAGFGSISALANGLLIETVKSGETVEIATVKTNGGLATAFPMNNPGSGLVILGSSTGMGGTECTFIGHTCCADDFILNDDDLIRATVRDNLSGLVTLKMAVHLGRIL